MGEPSSPARSIPPSHARAAKIHAIAAAHPTSRSARSPDRNGQIRRARQATGKAVGAPVLKLWNESRTNRARIADSVVVGIRSRPHLVARRLRTTKSCQAIETGKPLDAAKDLMARLSAEFRGMGGRARRPRRT